MAAAEVLDIPVILRQAAELDGVPIAILIRQATEAIEQEPEPEPEAEPQAPTLPLQDANGLYCRHVSETEAWKLIDSGAAIGLMPAGWNTDLRHDLPLLSVQLAVPRAAIQWSETCLSHVDMEAVAGLRGEAAEQRSREKLSNWKLVK